MKQRPRRLRSKKSIRDAVRETHLHPEQLIQPYFVKEGKNIRKAIRSMPGQFQLSVDQLVKDASKAYKNGIESVLLFGIPKKKDVIASGAYANDGIVQRAVKALKNKIPDLVVITDVCLCEYMSHGHCGVLRSSSRAPKGRGDPSDTVGLPRRCASRNDKKIDNDASIELLELTALSHVQAGSDIVAPSDMMDGRVKALRSVLDAEGHYETPIMSYAVKYASAFYGPFREAAESPPKFGDRRTYQMDPGNLREAIREAKLDEREGADVIMVKPALSYLDVIKTVRENTTLPVAAYQVSAEYAMIKAAAQKGYIDEQAVVMETLLSIRRAGADMIVSYFANNVAKIL